ncbi:sensor histidine kinase [Desulfosoma sp.]
MKTKKQAPPATVVLLCDAQGIIRNVLRDDLELGEALAPGRLFALTVDEDSFQKALNFLHHLKTQGLALDWVLNAPTGTEHNVVSLYFTGVRLDDGLLIIGARNGGEARRVLDELMRINNEQTNALRASLKERQDLLRQIRKGDVTLYDELTRVNNELATLQRELAKKNKELARLNELKSQFLAMAAHDLNHPIGVIQMYGEFLLDEAAPAMSPEHVGFLRIIVDSSRSMQQILNDFLDIAKIEAGRLELHTTPVNMESLVRQSVDLHQWHASKKGLRIVFTCSAPGIHATVDPPKMEQVLNNLLSNAVKFSPSGSLVHVRLDKHDDKIVIAVSDQGPGIPKEMLGRLFQPFERVPSRTGRPEKGSGLGLAIVKKIVQAHGGDVRVVSQEGEGSTFQVTVPAQRTVKAALS